MLVFYGELLYEAEVLSNANAALFSHAHTHDTPTHTNAPAHASSILVQILEIDLEDTDPYFVHFTGWSEK